MANTQALVGDYIEDERTELSGTQPEYATELDSETEDKLRIILNIIFSLSPMEILFLREIFNGKTLSQAGREIENFIKRN